MVNGDQTTTSASDQPCRRYGLPSCTLTLSHHTHHHSPNPIGSITTVFLDTEDDGQTTEYYEPLVGRGWGGGGGSCLVMKKHHRFHCPNPTPLPNLQVSGVRSTYVATCDYVPDSDTDENVVLRVGQVVEVIGVNQEGWWWVKTDGYGSQGCREGWVPASYLMAYKEDMPQTDVESSASSI